MRGKPNRPKHWPDNPENRIMVAQRYLQVMPPKEMLHEVANRVASSSAGKKSENFYGCDEQRGYWASR